MPKIITGALTAVILCFFSAALSTAVFADSENLLKDYTALGWSGDSLYIDEQSNALFFKNEQEKTEQSSVLSIEIEQSPTGFLFYVDVGNGAYTDDSGLCTLSFYNEEHEMLFSASTGTVKGLENYSRFSIGKSESYFPVPKGAKTAEVTVSSTKNGTGDNINVYFRNFTLLVSSEVPLLPEEKTELMSSQAGLTKVEIGLSPMTRWIWTGVVFLVALAFLIIAKWQQKYKVAKVMKNTDIRR